MESLITPCPSWSRRKEAGRAEGERSLFIVAVLHQPYSQACPGLSSCPFLHTPGVSTDLGDPSDPSSGPLLGSSCTVAEGPSHGPPLPPLQLRESSVTSSLSFGALFTHSGPQIPSPPASQLVDLCRPGLVHRKELGTFCHQTRHRPLLRWLSSVRSDHPGGHLFTECRSL